MYKELDDVEIKYRWQKSWESRQDEITKYNLISTAFYEYQKHLKEGENWGSAFRFPELFGAIERKHDAIMGVLPEVRIKGEDDGAIALQQTYSSIRKESNIDAAMNRIMYDAPFFGHGILMAVPTRYIKKVKDENGKQKEVLEYDGLGCERVDPRDFFPAYSAYKLHDHTGMENCPYIFRRRIYYYDTFMRKYSDLPGFNVAEVRPTTWGGGGFMDQKTPTQKESTEKEQGNDYVTVIEYWDQENDILRIYANDVRIFDSPTGIPYSHKSLPFHIYYNYRRHDSIAGTSEIELIMPYHLFRETVMNLMIDNIKLELQPAYVVDGDVNFNEEENELEPGAIFTVSGLAGGKLQDHIMPYRAGGVTQDVPGVISTIDDSYIAVTGDDKRALQANPGQLATQTLAKQQALQQRILNILTRNTVETEWYLAKQIISYAQNEFAEVYLDEEGKPARRKVAVSGYNVMQDKDESPVKFDKDESAEGTFYLNEEVSEMTKGKDVEIVPAVIDDIVRQDKYQSIMLFLQSLMNLASSNPAMYQSMLGDMDAKEFVKEIATNLKLDVNRMFPPKGHKREDYDIIDIEHEQIMLGINPPIKENEDSFEHYKEHVRFKNSALFKKRADKDAKRKLEEHLKDTMSNIVNQKANVGLSQAGQSPAPERGLPGAPSAGGEAPVPGLPQIPQEGLPGAAPAPIPPSGTPNPVQ